MEKKSVVIILALFLLLMVFSGCGGGQGSHGAQNNPATAQLTVIVQDESGNPVEGLKVSIGDKSLFTDSSGKAIFNALNPGDYTITVEKDGYSSESPDVSLKGGDKKEITISIEKEEAASSIKDITNLKSYKLVFEIKNSDRENSKIVIYQDDFGKKQHIIVMGNNGKPELEIYIVGDKAKAKTDDEKWMEIPSSTVSALASSTLGFAENLLKDTITSYNVAVKSGKAEYVVKKLGTETVNGYPTTKYHVVIADQVNGETGSIEGYIWVINSGPYKDYAARMDIRFKSGTEEEGFVVNLTDIGKDMHIKLP